MTSRKTHTVVAAHDGSERGLHAIAHAREIAEANGARLVVVHVEDKLKPWSSKDPERQHAVRERLARVFEPAHAVGGPAAETRTVEARSVIDGLAAAIEQEDADVVVVGPSHHAGIGRVVYGDVARALARRCDASVEVAPPRRARDAAAV